LIETTDNEDMVFTAGPIKPFRSEFSTLVNHLTLTASKTELSIFDGDGNRLAHMQPDTPFDKPLQIIRSFVATDPIFYVLTE